MRQNNDRKQISWKTVKYLAQAVSVSVIIFAVMLSLLSHPSNQVTEQQEVSEMLQAQNKVENSGSSATLSMQGAKVITTEEVRVVKRDRVKNITEISVKQDKTTAQDTETDEDILDMPGQNPTLDNARTGRNRVVHSSSVDKKGEAAGNRVVKNPEPGQLVSKLFENYGERPEISDDVIILFQYPVELGYAIDSNYDGKLMQKNTILNFTVDTNEEAVDKESDTKEALQEDDEDTGEEESFANEAESIETTEALDEREQFKQEIWSKIFSTDPIDVKITAEEEKDLIQEEKVTEEIDTEEDAVDIEENQPTEDQLVESQEVAIATEGTEDSNDTTIETEQASQEEEENEEDITTEEEDKVVADDTFFIIKGKMRTDRSVFVGDIEIRASGKHGFNKVRIGEVGEFQEAVIITEEAVNKSVTLYFTDGERVTTGVSWMYSKDTSNPEFQLTKDSYNVLESAISKIYCTNEYSLNIDMSDEDRQTSQVNYIYGDKLIYITDMTNDAKPTIQNDFYGRIMMNSMDHAGNGSNILSEYFLVEQSAPIITFSQDEFCTIPYSLWIQVSDDGHIVSGIQDVVCSVNGEEQKPENAKVLKKTILDEGLEVPSHILFPITFEEEGKYVVQVIVTDNAGNVTTQERMLEVKKPELVSVYMPEKFTIHIDPQQLAGREQIFSDVIELKNVSEFDVEVLIDSVTLKVDDEVSQEGVLKDCELYLVAPDTGEKIEISKGLNEDVYSYRLPMGAEGDIANLTFVGITTDGSEHMWKGSDISLKMKLSFRKWEEENPE